MTNVRCCGIMLGLAVIVLGLVMKARESHAQGLDSVSCRIICDDAGGSGTLLHVTADGARGLVLTNSHVVRDSLGGPFTVVFADGRSHGANLVQHDPDLDLAALEISLPYERRPAQWVAAAEGQTFFACGFGPFNAERFVVTSGEVVTRLGSSGGQVSIEISAASRQGDSGGGVFNERGELCGVRWGGDERSTVFVSPEQVAEFLGRLGVKPLTQCYGGQCPPVYGGGSFSAGIQIQRPAQPVGRPVYQLPPAAPIAAPAAALQPAGGAVAASPQPGPCACQCDCDCEGDVASLQTKIAALEARVAIAAAAKPAAVDLDGLAAQVTAKLPPLRVTQQDYYTGEVLDSGQVRLGEELIMRFGVRGEHAAR